MRAILAAFLSVLIPLLSHAATPQVRWAVSSYGTGGGTASLGCAGCASDQRSMAVDSAGNVVVAGFSDNGATLDDFKTVKFNGATGAVMWERSFGSATGYDQAWGMTLDAAGNAIVTGAVWNGTNYDIQVVKYASSDGAIAWQKSIAGPGDGLDAGVAVIADAAGNAIVGGYAFNGSNDDMRTIKFAAADGTVLWDKTFAGVANGNDYVFAMAADGAGNVIVTGESVNASSDWKTIKYAAGDGTILWQAEYDGAGGGLDIPYSIAIDSANNVIIAGNTFNGTDLDARIVKLAGSNGTVMWQKSFAGAAGGDDIFYSVALDKAGNAIATGFTFSGAGSNDWNTVKYRAADGTVLWQKSHAGSGNLSDVAVAVAIDAAGHAVVGGRINNSSDPANRDMHAAKFASSDGALVWSYTYGGSASAFDRVAAVATMPGAVFLAGESEEVGASPGWRIVKLGEAPVPREFNLDGMSDLLWKNTADGSMQGWLMNGLAATQIAGLLPAGGYSVTHVADLDGDGRADVLIRHTDGTVIAWLMNGLSVSGNATFFAAGSGWTVVATGDLNGDGKADLLVQHADGRVVAWIMNGLTASSTATFVPAGSGWSISKVADLNGDGKSDLLWQHTDGTVQAWLMDGTTATQVATFVGAGTGWSVARTGDFDGDGKADLLWQNADGRTQAWIMNGLAATSLASFTPAGTGWSPVLTGDIDGDGKADVFWEHTNGASQTWLMNGTAVTALATFVPAGTGWTASHLLDLNGDGRQDVLWKNTSGAVQAWLMNGLSISQLATLSGAGTYQVAPPAP